MIIFLDVSYWRKMLMRVGVIDNLKAFLCIQQSHAQYITDEILH